MQSGIQGERGGGGDRYWETERKGDRENEV